MAEKQDATNAAGADGGSAGATGDARPATLGDVRHLETSLRGEMNQLETSLRGEMRHMEDSLRGEMRELRNGQWKIIGIVIIGLPVMLELIPMIFELLRA